MFDSDAAQEDAEVETDVNDEESVSRSPDADHDGEESTELGADVDELLDGL